MNDMIHVGYACLNLDIHRGFKTCRFDSLTNEKWEEMIAWNLATLERMIEYTIDHHIGMLRISSDLIPFATKPKEGVNFAWEEHFYPIFSRLAQQITKGKLRISMHPGQYTVLNSPDNPVVERAIADLEYHQKLIKLLGGDASNKIIIHIGGVYGDKESAIERFVKVANSLSDKVRDHLIIENDERLYTIQDVLLISKLTGLPVVFDNLHHEVKCPDDPTPLGEYVRLAGLTWAERDGRQKIHYSQQAPGKKLGAHSESIRLASFITFVRDLPSMKEIDIMLEVKDKNRSAEKVQVYLDESVISAQKLWARYKYAVLAKSQKLYRQIREQLKSTEEFDVLRFIELIEDYESLNESQGDELNAAQHIWGYFKKLATKKELANFQNNLIKYQQHEMTAKQLRQFLKRMLKKYPNQYLENSVYFDS